MNSNETINICLPIPKHKLLKKYLDKAVVAGNDGIAIAGRYETAIGGDRDMAVANKHGTAVAGDFGLFVTMYGGNAVAGTQGKAFAGRHGLASGGVQSIAWADMGGVARAGEKGEIHIRYWDREANRYRTKAGYIGECGLKPDTLYRLNDQYEFEEVKEPSTQEEK